MTKNILRCFVMALLCVVALGHNTAFADAPPAPEAPQAVVSPRTETRLYADLSTVTPGRPFWLVLHIKLKDSWHTYWKNPGDSGTAPILNWTLPSGFTVGDIQYLAPDKLPVDPLMDYGYHTDAYYLIPVKTPDLVNKNATIIFMLKAQWLVCTKDICIPEKGEFSMVMPVTPAHGDPKPSDQALLIAGLVDKLPKPINETFTFDSNGTDVTFSVKLPKAVANNSRVEFYPATDGVISNTAPQKVDINGDTVHFSIGAGNVHDAKLMQGLVSVYEGTKRRDYAVELKPGTVSAPAPAPAAAEASHGEAQPAPISAQQEENRLFEDKPLTRALAGSTNISQALWFALLGGLILNLMPCVLPILSLKVLSVAKKARSQAGEVRKQAFAYTAGVVLSFVVMAAILLLLQKLLGQALGWGFQMQSPLFVSFLAVVMFLVGLNLSGAYEVPVLLGNAGSDKANEDSASGSFLTGVLAVLVATPCTAPFMAPAIGFALTQNAEVVIMVFAMLGVGLAAPFLLLSFFPALVRLLPKPGAWMLTLKQFLAFPIYLTVVWLLWIIIGQAGANGAGIAMLAMVLAGFCIFLLKRDTWLGHIMAILLAIAIVKGMITYITPMPRNPQPATYSAAEMKYSYSPEKLAELRKAGKPVFVYATAEWCITCKVNEAVALEKPEVKAAFKERHISILVADWTDGDAEITKYLQSFDRSGVPIYVFYPEGGGEPQVLPQVLTPSILIDATMPRKFKDEEAAHE